MEIVELALVWAIIVTITLGIIMTFLIKLRKKHEQDILDKENEIQDMNNRLEKRQTHAFRSGVNVTAGDYSQILGDFALLSKYDSIITLSTTFSQASIDLIGINKETIDFLELKKKGSGSTANEMHVKRLVDEKKVDYKIFDVELPKNFSINERTQKESKQKEPTPKKPVKKDSYMSRQREVFQSAYKRWKPDDDEFLIKYWNDESNKRNRDEIIKELSEKLCRNIGGIKSRLAKHGFIEDDFHR